MTSNPQSPNDDPPPTIDFGGEEQAEQLVRILDQYLAELKAGRKPNRAALLAENPQLADQLAACLAGLEFIQGVEATSAGVGTASMTAQRVLGDFRILREVGRGGMGAVYEAEQLSLGRRVALKVLRFGGVSDPEALDRFRREAETVARLHHTNIVPIFAVGSDQGVNFYAMQFIEGKSLAEVRPAANEQPLDPREVMQWGLQAAEALAHAHDRNVIHRDVKPSNLLLDPEGRIWLTDFGLARRLDDVTLSMTGALLGTPRYMSPEQASASRQKVDRRTDIYSLGATLYELLTGRPVFSGDTPHRVIQQILSTEPIPLRQLCPTLPRDLETVVMKCLAKDVEHRYGSARELADDLRACLEQRPIRARRAGLAEQAVRWIRGRRQGVRISSYAVAATLLLVVTAALGMSWYHSSRQVSVLLTTPTPPLTAEFVAGSGEPILAATVPTERPVVLQDGDYELRVSNPDRWSQTFQTSLRRGESLNREIDLQDQQVWLPTVTPRWWSVVDDTAGAALLLWNDQGVTCESGVPKKLRWKFSFNEPRPEAFEGAPGLLWPWFKGPESAHHSTGPTEHAPCVASRTVDVNRDGLGDFIVAARHQAFVMALSGADGKVLWCAARGADVRKELHVEHADQPRSLRSTIVGVPLVTDDHDGDGVPDLIVTCADTGTEPLAPKPTTKGGGSTVDSERWVELTSGATGKTIWKRVFPEEWFELADGDTVPTSFQWLMGTGYGTSSGMVGGNQSLRRHYIRHGLRSVSRTGMHAYLSEPARILRVGESARIAVVAGRHVEWLDPATGKSVVESPLTALPGCSGSWADVDGDGVPEFIYLERISSPSPGPALGSSDVARLIVWSVRDHKSLWSVALGARFPLATTWTIPPPQWPLIADLDGDGLAEIIAPDSSSAVAAPGTFVEVPWGELVVFDGRTGTPRWRQQIVTCDQQIDHMAVGPDIDGDGHRELYVATLANLPMRLYVEARSGKSGEALWRSSSSIRTDARLQDRFIGVPRWWNAGEDGWPQLVVTVHNETTSPMETDAMLFSAATGRVTRKRRQVAEVRVCDVDHDGVEDLLTYRATDLAHPEDGGTIDGLRGMAAEPWNRLGPEGVPAADFNGDGIRDLLRADSPNHFVAAICGRHGTTIWETKVGSLYSYAARPLAEPSTEELERTADGAPAASLGDVDGDGTVDVIFWPVRQFGAPTAMLGVISGRTGRVLWRAEELSARISDGLVDFRLADLDRDGKPELVLIVSADIGYPQRRNSFSSDDLQCWLIVMSGRTGAIRWKSPLSCAYGSSAPASAKLPPAGSTSFPARTHGQLFRLLTIADLDSDGTPDLLAPAIAATGQNLEFHAYRGGDGAFLWKHSLPAELQMQEAFIQQHVPRAVDLDQDGRTEVLLIERDLSGAQRPSNDYVPRLCVLEGATGAVLWRQSGERNSYDYQPFFQGERRGISDIALPRAAGGKVVPTILFTGTKPRLMSVEGPDRVTFTPLPDALEGGTLWCCDVDADGVDELAYVLAGKVCLVGVEDLGNPRWKCGSNSTRYARILETRNATNGRPAEIVALRAVGDNSVVGLNAATGQERWVSAAPIPRERQSYVTPQITARLDVDPQSEMPYVLFQYNQVTHCRRAAKSTSGQRESTGENLVALTSVSRPLRSWSSATPDPSTDGSRLARDPRWARDLPWVAHAGNSPEMISFVLRSGLFALTLIILPMGYVRWMIRRKQWGLRTMFVLPLLAVIAIAMTTTRVFGDEGLGGWERWGHALLATPPLVLFGRMMLWFGRQQWRRTVAWCLATVFVALAMAGIQLLNESLTHQFQSAEYYVAEHWYFVVDVAFYITSLVALPAVAIENWLSRRKGKA